MTQALPLLLNLVGCLLAADFLSGLIHWAEDTWAAPGGWAFLDKHVVLPNIEHHRSPGLMRGNSYLVNNSVTLAITAAAALVLFLAHVYAWQAYVTLAIASHSNAYHRWAHMRNVPRPVRWLQGIGLLQSVQHHGVHHKRPYASRFCTTTNFLNPILDGFGFWRALEYAMGLFGARVVRATDARGGY
jgi:ubiquitin-conjugating enzyme E2 variant